MSPLVPPAMAALARRTRTAVLALTVGALASLAVLAARVYHAWILTQFARRPVALAAIDRSDQLITLGGVSTLVVTALCVIALARWTSAATRAAHALGAPALAYTPRAALASYIIPVVHLVRPVRVLAALARAARDHGLPDPGPRVRSENAQGYRDNAGEDAAPPVHVPRAPIAAFWALWLTAQLASRAGDLLARTASSVPEVARATVTDAVGTALLALALLLAARVVHALHAALREYHRRARR